PRPALPQCWPGLFHSRRVTQQPVRAVGAASMKVGPQQGLAPAPALTQFSKRLLDIFQRHPYTTGALLETGPCGRRSMVGFPGPIEQATRRRSNMAAIDVDAYFQRIGYAGKRTPTLETLRALHARHTEAIPFENLNPLLKWPVRLDAPSLEEKLVRG